MTKKNGIIRTFFSSLWRVFNFTRAAIINLFFFIFLLSFIVLLAADDESQQVPDNTALVLNLVGDIVEQKRAVDPMEAFLSEALEQDDDKPEILITELISVIEKAKDDERIQIIVLQLQGLNRTGLSKLQDVASALESFKSSGKTLIALGDQYTQDQYYLASVADEIWLNPQGFMLLDGYGTYQMYFKTALEKLAINQHIFRVGTYKSAVEPFLRDDMSAEAKEANKLWLNDLWSQYKADVAKRRDFSVENFDDSIEQLITKFSNADSSFAQYAHKNQWVDELKTREEMRLSLIDMVGKNEKGTTYSHIGYKKYQKAAKQQVGAEVPAETNIKEKVAIIVAKGTILDGKQKPGTIGGDSTAKLLRKARNDNSVKAVVLRVDSPGGSAYASEIIRQEVELLKQSGKPVVASMGTYAASGGYWISASANKIYAAPSTITGSIGIFGMMMTFEESLGKLGVYTDGVGTTDIAGFGPTQALTPNMAKLFQLAINKGYQEFIQLVAENRDMTIEQVDSIAQGRVWSGTKAKELGLVDELGNLQDAILAAATIAELAEYDTKLIEEEQSPRHKLMQQLFGKTSKVLALFSDGESQSAELTDLLNSNVNNAAPINQLLKRATTQIQQLQQYNDPQGKYVLCVVCEVN